MFTNLWGFVSAWYNLPFTLLLGLCAVLAGLQLVGLGGDDDSDADPDMDHDLDHDAEADTDADHDAEADHEADTDHNADHDNEADSQTHTLSLLAFLGLGKAPLMVVLLILFGSLGILGWSLNAAVLAISGDYPAVMLALTGPVALVAAASVTSRVARFIGKALPPISTTASKAESLVGSFGIVISPFVDLNYGQIHLRDSGGTLISVFAVNESGDQIKRGDKVVLVSYKAQRKCYVVIRSREGP